MTGPKLNEGATIAGERAGTKASGRYIRSSASKAREVLNLIRGLDVRRADEVLQFTDRAIARDIRKVLASAVANAVHNDEHDADELYVLACFADEGPTLRRFRPRARGRATRIRKRSCHITVIVARMSDDRLAVVQARESNRGATGRRRPGTSAQSRRERVERSRKRAASLKSATATSPDDQPEDSPDDLTDEPAPEPDDFTEDVTDEATPAEGSASDEAEAARGESEADAEPAIDKGSASDEAEPSAVESEADDKEGN